MGELADFTVQARRVTVLGFVYAVTFVASNHASQFLIHTVASADGLKTVTPRMVRLHVGVSDELANEFTQSIVYAAGPAPNF